MQKRNLTSGNVTSDLFLVAVPTMMTQLLMFSYSIIDLKFVSILGTKAIAAVGSATLFIGIGNSLNALSIIGTGILVSQIAGKNDKYSYYKVINSGYFINLIINIMFILVFTIFPKQLLSLINISDASIIEMAVKYLRVFSLAMVFQFTNNLIIRILTGLGLTNKILLVSLIGVIINIILDALFINGFGWGVSGAAFASLFGNCVITIIFFTLYSETLKYSFDIKIDFNVCNKICKLGIPYMLQRFTFTFVGIVMGRLVASYGAYAIAAQKIGYQVESITFLVLGGLFSAVSAFSGQNMGALQYDRVRKGYKSAIKIGICYTTITSIIFILFSNNIASIFDDNLLTVKYTEYYLKTIAFAQFFVVFEMVGNGFYMGIGKPKIPAINSIVFTTLRIPLAIILSQYFGVLGIFISIAITSIIKGVVSYGIYKFKVFKQIGNKIFSI
ncbi:MAG: MATE family efflux transporter [Bacilli bacterium]